MFDEDALALLVASPLRQRRLIVFCYKKFSLCETVHVLHITGSLQLCCRALV